MGCAGSPAAQDFGLFKVMFFYLAADVEKISAPALDAGEDIEIVRVPLEQAFERVENGKITNGMVQLAIAFYRMRQEEPI